MVYTLTKTSDTSYTFANENSKEFVHMSTNDNVNFRVARECCPKMRTIESQLDGGFSGEIPLFNVRADQFIAILKFMIIDMERDPIPEIDVSKVQIPDGEPADWWIGKAKRQNMRDHAISIPKEIWGTLSFLNGLVKNPEVESLERPGGPADYLDYENFCYAWGKTMGENLPENVDEARELLGLKPVIVTRPQINEYEEEVKDADGNVVTETVTEWRG
jgi:hypothetical protein